MDGLDMGILRVLGENTRIPTTEIARRLGVSVPTVKRRIDELKKLGLRCGIELDLPNLGLGTEFFVKVALRKKAPIAKLEGLIKNNPYVQFCAETYEDFDIFFWTISTSPAEYEEVFEARVRTALDEYIDDWVAHGLLVKRYGFLPVGNDLIGTLDLDEKDRKLICLLNENSRASLAYLGRRVGLSKPAVKRRIDTLYESGFIRRFTAFLDTPKRFLYAIRFWQVTGPVRAFRTVGRRITRYYTSSTFFNRFAYATVPDGGMDNFLLEVHTSPRDLERTNSLLESARGVVISKMELARIGRVFKGSIPVRGLDTSREVRFLLSPVEVSS